MNRKKENNASNIKIKHSEKIYSVHRQLCFVRVQQNLCVGKQLLGKFLPVLFHVASSRSVDICCFSFLSLCMSFKLFCIPSPKITCYIVPFRIVAF